MTGRADPKRGFSLLEIILALAILTGAIAVLGELARLGLQNARLARDTTYAQLLCQSKMAEITSGAYHPEPIAGASLETSDSPGDSEWLYSIELAQTDLEALLAVRVTVAQALAAEKRPISFSMVQWILDPDYEFVLPEAESESKSSSESTSETSTGGSR